MVLFRALPLALAQLADASSRRVLALSIAGTLILLVVLVVAVGWLLAGVAWFGVAWIDGALGALGTAATLILAWLLFPSMLAAMTAVLVDPISDAVEARYYPGLPPTRGAALVEGLRSGLTLAGVALALNLMLLPLYLVPGVNVMLFYGLNGYLVARAYFEQVAVRRVALAEARALFRRHRLALWLGGTIMTFMTTVPFLNLVVPIVATALMTHLVEDLRAR
ncbi:MAG: EI24 domain-containing protein [Proteobacteria bacterium]|nr:EI24 domain-containing protein [Pseudomonadota bacterium]